MRCCSAISLEECQEGAKKSTASTKKEKKKKRKKVWGRRVRFWARFSLKRASKGLPFQLEMLRLIPWNCIVQLSVASGVWFLSEATNCCTSVIRAADSKRSFYRINKKQHKDMCGEERSSRQMTGCFWAEEQLPVSTVVIPKLRICWNARCWYAIL